METAIIPVSPHKPSVLIHRDLSHATLRSHAKGRSLHASPLSIARLYDICGDVNEHVRNNSLRTDFAVVWLGEVPPRARAHAATMTQMDADSARVLVFVYSDGVQAGTVLWMDGTIAATCSDEALRATNALLHAFGLRQSRFQTLNTAFARLKEWGPTRQAAVVCTVAKAVCADVDPVHAVELLPPSDAFVVQYDGVAKGSDCAIADVLTHAIASAHDPLLAPLPMFNSHVRLFF